MIHLKSAREIGLMRGASKIVAEILLELRDHCGDGVSTGELDRIAEDLIQKKKARPAFKGYRGFPACVCISINDEVVHGIPSPKRVLKNGDVVVVVTLLSLSYWKKLLIVCGALFTVRVTVSVVRLPLAS